MTIEGGIKVRNRVLSIILSTILLLGLGSTKLVSAKELDSKEINKVLAQNEDGLSEANRLLIEALQDKNFYRYNMAYASIMKIDDENTRNSLLGKLLTIQKDVWTQDIKRFNAMFDELIKTNGSGKIYDEVYAAIKASSLVDLDKWYLLGELDSWGRKLVFTADYSEAVSKVVEAWEISSKGTKDQLQLAIVDAEKAVASVSNTYSKAYLNLEIIKLKEKNGFTVVDIN